MSIVFKEVFHDEGGAYDDEPDEKSAERCDPDLELEPESDKSLDLKLQEATTEGIRKPNRVQLEAFMRDYRQKETILLNGGTS